MLGTRTDASTGKKRIAFGHTIVHVGQQMQSDHN